MDRIRNQEGLTTEETENTEKGGRLGGSGMKVSDHDYDHDQDQDYRDGSGCWGLSETDYGLGGFLFGKEFGVGFRAAAIFHSAGFGGLPFFVVAPPQVGQCA